MEKEGEIRKNYLKVICRGGGALNSPSRDAERVTPSQRSYISRRKVSTARSTPAYPRKRLILASRPVLHPLIRRVKLLAVTTKRRKGPFARFGWLRFVHRNPSFPFLDPSFRHPSNATTHQLRYASKLADENCPHRRSSRPPPWTFSPLFQKLIGPSLHPRSNEHVPVPLDTLRNSGYGEPVITSARFCAK